MNRRSFITKVLAGLAAAPLIGKLIQAEPDFHAPSPHDNELIPIRLPWSFSLNRKLTDAELRRQGLLRYLDTNEYVETTADVASRIFADFDHEQIDAFCEENNLLIQARLSGLIRISKLWQITVANHLVSL